MLPWLLLPAAWILGQFPRCIAGISNRTIDDSQGDIFTGFIPTYTPTEQWNVGQDCSGCHVQPDPSQVFDRSWHDTTTEDGGPQSSVTLEFTGTAIYVFCIVPNTLDSTTTIVNLQFTLDGTVIGTYKHTPDTSSTILYSVPVLSSQNLANKPHTLVAATASVNASLFVFDYAIYTFDDSSTSSQSTSPTLPTSQTSTSQTPTSQTNGTPSPTSPTSSSPSHKASTSIIAGSVVGAVIAVAALVALILCVRRNGRRSTPVAASAGRHPEHRPDLNALLDPNPSPRTEALGRGTVSIAAPSADAFNASALYTHSPNMSMVAVDSSGSPSVMIAANPTTATNTSPSVDASSASGVSTSAPSMRNNALPGGGVQFYSDRKSQLPPPYTQ